MKIKKFLLKLIKILAAIAVVAIAFNIYFKLTPTANSKFTLTSITKNEIHLTAHRGLSNIAPENTAPALEEAGKAGYYAAEFDIMPTKDGKWIMMHDSTVDRTMTGEGEVGSYTYNELLEMNIDYGSGIENYPNLKISTLEEALEICRKYSMRPMIEIKGGEAEDMQGILNILRSANVENAIIIDFNQDRIRELRRLDGEIDLWILTNKTNDKIIDFAKENNAMIGFNHLNPVNYFYINDAKRAGVSCGAWTVDRLAFLDILSLFGVDYITTNRILP